MSFFFQAEDGIRDRDVTGVQTCALPILRTNLPVRFETASGDVRIEGVLVECDADGRATSCDTRSEEHTSELQSHHDLVCRLLLEKKKPENLKSTHPKQQEPHAPHTVYNN